MGDYATSIFMNVITATVIFFLGRWIAIQLKTFLVSVMERKGIDAMLVSFTGNVAYIAMIVFVIITALGHLGIQTTSFVAIIGAAGLAIALSLQSSLANFASGVMIILFRPFKTGDFVEAGGVSGVVEGIQIFSTQMKTGDNKSIIVPNASITGGNITNYSAKEERRVDMIFGIGYDDDLKKAKDILLELVNKDERILKEPATVIAVGELGDSSVNLICRPWVKTGDYWAVYWDMTEAVKLRFDKEGISIPYPQQDVHMHQAA